MELSLDWNNASNISRSQFNVSQQATADGIKLIKEAGADNAVLTLKAYEALGVMADGKATKIIVPSDLQGVASLATTIKEIVSDKDKK